MKVKAIRTRYADDDKSKGFSLWKKGDVCEISIQRVTCCCDDMTAAWGDFIGFGEADSVLNKETSVNIYHCSPYPEGAVFDSMPIRFCPFCAARIHVEIEDDLAALNQP